MTTSKRDDARAAHLLLDSDGAPTRDEPWVFRTYGGHSSAAATNALMREGLARGQTGLSIAFDLPTQCGYSSDHPMARAEVGKVGVPINSLDDMHAMFADVPLGEMNTSMTINGTAMWLLALYVAMAQERGVDVASLRGTTQNDIMKEYLARGTYVFPPAASMRLIAETYEYCAAHVPLWNPSNICSYHLQEAGATPAQEIAFALANALQVLDGIAARGALAGEDFQRCIGRMSFFVNAGIRFVEEMCKLRAFAELWDELLQARYGVTNPKFRLFRYGVQVNSLGLTAAQPENNAWRIAFETLAVTLSRKARCRALQLPAWNEALSLPRPWDQQWALRLQQILALETDLLEYPDLFEGSVVVESKTAALREEARALLGDVLRDGGALAALETGAMKQALVGAMAQRMGRIASGQQVVVGVNRYQEALSSPLVDERDGGRFVVDEATVAQATAQLARTRTARDEGRVQAALTQLVAAAASAEQAQAKASQAIMLASIECAKARVTTGEWADALRGVFGEYRANTGVDGARLVLQDDQVAALRARSAAIAAARGRRPRLVVGKPGLDGHSNGAEMIAVAAREAGFDVIYAGIRVAPAELAQAYIDEDADILGISLLSGSHLELVRELATTLSARGCHDACLVVGGIVPASDLPALAQLGVRRVFGGDDYQLGTIMHELLALVEAGSAA
ncbi:MAG: cobalamin-dependent protein [Myxococcales bacterium]|nr:cobalamin-dependent protein [Myxococcales bacterium]